MTASHYDRLGGHDALAIFATKTIETAQQDGTLHRFWANRNEDTKTRDLQSLIDVMVNATGGQMSYHRQTWRLLKRAWGSHPLSGKGLLRSLTPSLARWLLAGPWAKRS